MESSVFVNAFVFVSLSCIDGGRVPHAKQVCIYVSICIYVMDTFSVYVFSSVFLSVFMIFVYAFVSPLGLIDAKWSVWGACECPLGMEPSWQLPGMPANGFVIAVHRINAFTPRQTLFTTTKT